VKIACLVPIALAVTGALAQERWPEAAERRFEEAAALSQRGDYAGAALAFHEVADWAGGAFPERAQALFCAGLNEKNAQRYEKAIETWREVVRRFPTGDFVKRARTELGRLDMPGGVDFARRRDEALSVLDKARQASDDAARPTLERALRILEPLLFDHRDHPEASDVALSIQEARTRLGDLDGARRAAEEAVTLAREAAARAPSDPQAAANVANAELHSAEADRLLLRRAVARVATTILVLVLGALVALRPWRTEPGRLFRAARFLVAAPVAVAPLAMLLAWAVRRYVDDHSPLASGDAAALVALPGFVAVVVALGIASAVKGPRGAALAWLCGALAGTSIATLLVQAFGLFGYLDSKL
jgi:tetratricopeptide (TPR) repeat protein